MRNRRVSFFTAAFAGTAILLSSCTIAKIGGKGSMPLILNNPPAKVQIIEHFSESKMITFDYTSSFDVSEILADVMSKSKADAITNLTVTIKSDVGTFFINLFTLGLAAAHRVEITGDFVKAPNGLGEIMHEGKLLGEVKDGNPYMMKLDEINNTTVVRTDDGYAILK